MTCPSIGDAITGQSTEPRNENPYLDLETISYD